MPILRLGAPPSVNSKLHGYPVRPLVVEADRVLLQAITPTDGTDIGSAFWFSAAEAALYLNAADGSYPHELGVDPKDVLLVLAMMEGASTTAATPVRNPEKRRLDSPSARSDNNNADADPGEGSGGEQGGKRQRRSFSRGIGNTARQGYVLGVATWNVHGFQKPKNLPAKTALDFAPRLADVYALCARLHRIRNPEGGVLAGAAFLDAACTLATGKDRSRLKYLRALTERWQLVTGEALGAGAVDASADTRGEDELAGPLEDAVEEAIRRLLRKLACRTILKLFEVHGWLDALVMQEVKYTGIEMLEEELAGTLDVYRGPKMVSTTGGSDSEVEYFPLILRKGGASNNHVQGLKVDRTWWIKTDGTARTGPRAQWNKKMNIFRPVVVYDLRIGDNGPVAHLAIVHTTPGERETGLTERERESIAALDGVDLGKTRKGEVKSHEFQRPHQFFQVKAVFDQVRTWAYESDGQHDAYLGPWVLAGDYYLFRDARVVDLETAYGSDEHGFGKLGPKIAAELERRVKECATVAPGADHFCAREALWGERYAQEAKTYDEPGKDQLPREDRRLLERDLRADATELARIALRADPVTRGRVRFHRDKWLDQQKYYGVVDDATMVVFAGHRQRLYADLCDLCTFYGKRWEALAPALGGDVKAQFRALRADNAALLKRGGAPSTKEGTTSRGIHVGVDDPMRAQVGITFREQVDPALEITQAVSGTNLDEFRDLASLPAVDQDGLVQGQADVETVLGDRADRAARIKVADFLVHTRYDARTGKGVNHWAASCVGLLSPDQPTVVLADSPDLTVSRFWAGLSDHFPMGGLLSTTTDPHEPERLRNRLARPSGVPREAVEALDLERHRYKAEELVTLARMALDAQTDEIPILDVDYDELPGVLDQLGGRLVEELSAGEAFGLIGGLEKVLDVPPDDRFTGREQALSAADFEWTGPLTFGTEGATLPPLDPGELDVNALFEETEEIDLGVVKIEPADDDDEIPDLEEQEAILASLGHDPLPSTGSTGMMVEDWNQ
ncbi:MAG TPA: hypothetical protein VF541_15410 [Longimicrobium sp.]